MDELLMGLLNPQQQAAARQQAQQAGLLNLGFGLLQASRGAPGMGRPGLGQIVGQAGPQAMQAYQGSIDQTLRNIMLKQQMEDAQAKRARETAVQRAMGLPTTREQIEALRGIGAYSEIGGIASAEKALRQSGILRQPGEAAVENPFTIYAQSQIPGVSKLAKQYQKSYESGSIDDEKATARLGELAQMEQSAFARQESAEDRKLSRELAASERKLTRETAAGEREQKRLEGTEGQKLAAGFAERMVASEAIIEQLPQSALPTEFTSLSGGVPVFGGYLQRKAMTPEQQKYKQAADNWIRANLRKESGAVIGADEMQAEYETYFPQPGDSQEVIQQKAEARKITAQAMIKNAGPVFSAPAIGQRPKPKDVRSKFNLEPPR
jgi:hypothetical protein